MAPNFRTSFACLQHCPRVLPEAPAQTPLSLLGKFYSQEIHSGWGRLALRALPCLSKHSAALTSSSIAQMSPDCKEFSRRVRNPSLGGHCSSRGQGESVLDLGARIPGPGSATATNRLPFLNLNLHNCEMGVAWVTPKIPPHPGPLSPQKLLQAEHSWA